MTMPLTVPRRSLSGLATALAQVTRRMDHRADLIAELVTAQLVTACFVPGIEHQAAAAIVRTGMPTVEHQRRTLQWRIDEHLFLDTPARTGVRVLACWDDRAHRVRMHVAEVGEPGLWDRIVAHFTRWEMTGRPVPATSRTNGSGS
ncbi:hypothetical protein [Amycolatopsis sp. EV170708-02-1]|uniref:hypothetical protein n=1 Tax=Amycolatopsis sp. EV170708-02-1 TaxID=2919322 RepID=UPI001F0B782C|nr:hypothetical protein [Amycolatopsis sp. EV170708-02-1]UMP06899.1 hypothetical protein MJQ72_19730 [Amycolatopsis sp. EV170708-02-1]